jgi:hypothetical protein
MAIDVKTVIDNFVRRGRRYLENPGAIAGMEFDDAAVAMRSQAGAHLQDSELATRLGQFGALIRQQKVDEVRALFDEVLEALAGHGYGGRL